MILVRWLADSLLQRTIPVEVTRVSGAELAKTGYPQREREREAGSVEKPRVCFVMRFHPYYNVGGAEVQAWLLAKELARRGWETHYVFEHEDSGRGSERREGVHMHRRKLRRRTLQVFGYRDLCTVLGDIDAQIYYQRIGLPLTGMVARFAQSRGKKFVWASSHFHDCVRDKFTQDRKMTHIHTYLLGKVNNVLYTRGIEEADLIISQSHEQYRLLKQSFGRESVVIRNAYPIPEQSGFRKDVPPVVLWVANLKPWKRPELFVDLAQRCRHVRAHFVMIGGGEGDYARGITDRVRGVPNLEYRGPLSLDEVNRLFEVASVFVNTSVEEGFPNTFIQAWMRETPTVSLTVDPDGVIRENGLGFRSGSLQKLVEDVTLLVKERSLVEQMGQNARQYAMKEHNITKSATLLEENLFELLKR